MKKSDVVEEDDDVIVLDPEVASQRKKFLMSTVPDEIRKQQVIANTDGIIV